MGWQSSIESKLKELENRISDLESGGSTTFIQPKKDIDESQNVSMSGVTKNEQGQTENIENMPGNSDNQVEKSEVLSSRSFSSDTINKKMKGGEK